MSCIYLGPRLGHLSHIFQHSPELVLNILFFTYSWNYVIYNKYNKLLLSFKTWYIPIIIADYGLNILPFEVNLVHLMHGIAPPLFQSGACPFIIDGFAPPLLRMGLVHESLTFDID